MIDLDSTPARYRGTIEVYADGLDWRWRCKSRNGQILGHGEGYRRKAGALNAIDAMFGARLVRPVSGADILAIVPWRLVIVDRHGTESVGAVY